MTTLDLRMLDEITLDALRYGVGLEADEAAAARHLVDVAAADVALLQQAISRLDRSLDVRPSRSALRARAALVDATRLAG